MSFRVSWGCHSGCHLKILQGFFRVSFMASGLIDGLFRVHLGFHVGFLIRIYLGFLWVSPGDSLGFHLGYKQERIKQQKMKSN